MEKKNKDSFITYFKKQVFDNLIIRVDPGKEHEALTIIIYIQPEYEGKIFKLVYKPDARADDREIDFLKVETVTNIEKELKSMEINNSDWCVNRHHFITKSDPHIDVTVNNVLLLQHFVRIRLLFAFYMNDGKNSDGGLGCIYGKLDSFIYNRNDYIKNQYIGIGCL